MEQFVRPGITGLLAIMASVWVAVAGPAGAAEPQNLVTAGEIRQLVADHTAEVRFVRTGQQGYIYFRPTGEVDQLITPWLQRGRWKVGDNDRLCLHLGESDWDCRMLVRNGSDIEQYIVKKDGNHQLEQVYRNFVGGNTAIRETPSQPFKEILDRDHVVVLFFNKTVESETVTKGRKSSTYYRPDGTVELLRSGNTHGGTWRVTLEGQMCLQLEELQEKCRIIVREGDEISKYIVKKNGQHLKSVFYRRFLPGKQF